MLTDPRSRAAVLGSPVGHSLSPVMHRAAYERLGLDWEYERHECDERHLAPFVAPLDERWRGLSLTMPLKEVAFDVADRVDPVAADVGAINTLVRTAAGWDGYNTDVHGIEAALRRQGVTDAGRVLVLGSGATTRSALRAVRGLGCREVTFAVRAQVRPETLEYARQLGIEPHASTLARVGELVGEQDLVVDTLPGHAGDSVAQDLADHVALPPLFEVVYEDWPTALARTFAATGAPVASGLVMLAYQAAEQVRLMTGAPPPAGLTWDDVAEHMLAAATARVAAG